ncbi:unnamed protein product, partial [Meganyctiphanes norvegica]
SLTSVAQKQTVAEELGLPPPPKIPINGYFRYAAAIRPNIKRQYPKMEARDITARLALHWQNLPPIEKDRWNKEFQKDKEAYALKLAEYLRKLSPKQIEDMKDLKSKRRQDKQKRTLKRERKRESEELGKPKHPGNVFMQYLMSLDRGEATMKEFLSGAASRWRSLPEEDKEVYRRKAKVLKDQYEAKLKNWEMKMIREGRPDLVRRQNQIEDLSTTQNVRRSLKNLQNP